MKMRVTSFMAAMVAVVGPALVAQAQNLVLRGDVVVYGAVATVGDFFENAGSHANKPLFRSPDLGHRGSVPVWQILDRMLELGVTRLDGQGLENVDVTRASQYLTGADFIAMTKSEISNRLDGAALEDIDISADTPPSPIHAIAGSSDAVLLRRLTYSPRSGRFLVQFTVDTGTRQQEVSFRGTARETQRTVALTRPIGRGEQISAEDIIETRLLARNVTQQSAVSAEQLVGMEAKRNLRENTAINLSDVQYPTLIERNQSVTITYRSAAMILSAQGRALTAGSKGDMINVLNLQSNRPVQGQIMSSGEVLVLPRTLRLAAAKE